MAYRDNRKKTGCLCIICIALFTVGLPWKASGQVEIAPVPDPVTGDRIYTIYGPGDNDLPITVGHLGKASVGQPRPTPETEFRPPSIFSAPLPVGSGARSLGFSGAFVS